MSSAVTEEAATHESSSPAPPEISVVIPVHDESGAILPLLNGIYAALEGVLDYEILVVDDGSRDDTAGELATGRRFLKRLRVVTHRERAGQSAALVSGILAARGTWIVTLDGDGQNDPADILRLWEKRPAESEQEALVCGVRVDRRDGPVKRVSSRLANGVRRRVLGDGSVDTGCGLKLMRRDLFLRLPRFRNMHRFLPALAHACGSRVEEVAVGHHPRTVGRSKYGTWKRLVEGIVDLAGVYWLTHRQICVELVAQGKGVPR